MGVDERNLTRRTRTREVGEAAHALSATHDASGLEVTTDGKAFLFEESVAGSELLSLESTSCSGTVSGRLRSGPFMAVSWLKSGRGRIGGHRMPIGRPVLFHQGQEPFEWSSFQVDLLRIDRQLVREVAAERGGWPPGPLQFQPHHVPEGAMLAAWWLMVRCVAGELLGSDAPVTEQRMQELARIAAGGLLTAIPHWPEGHDRVSPARARLAKAEMYLLDNATRDVLVEDVAQVAGISVRGLQAAFRRIHGTTPLGYLRAIRLEMARERFETGAAGTVAEAAKAVGIGHLGRFAVAYRQEFGISPGEALRLGRAALGERTERSGEQVSRAVP